MVAIFKEAFNMVKLKEMTAFLYILMDHLKEGKLEILNYMDMEFYIIKKTI